MALEDTADTAAEVSWQVGDSCAVQHSGSWVRAVVEESSSDSQKLKVPSLTMMSSVHQVIYM